MSLLTRKDIARILGVTAETVRKRVEIRPDFPAPAVRLSQKTVRWEPSDFNRWLAQHKSAQT
jgi:predicted DNA-binding transcriptional regulator AlpA